MPNRITFTACLAYAWCLVETDETDEDGNAKEERTILTALGHTPGDAANTLVENYNLDPSTEVRTVVISFDADDPTAPGAEVHVPTGAAPVVTFDPSAHVKE